MSSVDDMPIPALEEALTLTLELGPTLTLGRLATGGIRALQEVVGGNVDGAAGIGLVAGGGETRLARGDGITMLDVNYLLVMNQGSTIRALGSGYVTESPHFEGSRLIFTFEVDEASPHAWLSTRAFLGERLTGASQMRIVQVL